MLLTFVAPTLCVCVVQINWTCGSSIFFSHFDSFDWVFSWRFRVLMLPFLLQWFYVHLIALTIAVLSQPCCWILQGGCSVCFLAPENAESCKVDGCLAPENFSLISLVFLSNRKEGWLQIYTLDNWMRCLEFVSLNSKTQATNGEQLVQNHHLSNGCQ